MTRRTMYYDSKLKILEHLATQTDNGKCSRSQLVEKFGLPKSSATDILKGLKKQGLISTKDIREIRSGSVNKLQVVLLTDKGRKEYFSKFEQGEFRFPSIVKKYFANRKISEENLFPIQQDFANRGLIYSKSNVCVFGYPGAGKTLVAEMAMAHEISEGGKVLYCTPYKALDRQKSEEFNKYFAMFPNCKVVAADSDNPAMYDRLKKASIIVATYERVLGSLKINEDWLNDVTLVCADELTLLEDDRRGGNIDLILTNLKKMEHKPRIITLSSLVGNPHDIARWLDAETIIENRPPANMTINENLVFAKDDEIHFWNKDGKKTIVKSTEKPLDYLVKKNLDDGLTTVIFVGLKPSVEKIAELFSEFHKADSQTIKMAEEFFSKNVKITSQTKNVLELIKHGIAYHHAGLQKDIRRFIEKLLNENRIKTVVATTTLSHGVDYKIDSVIVDMFSINFVREGLSIYEYINLKGRAGRPGKSKSADVYLLTPRNPDAIFTKYFLTSPESISSGRFDQHNVGSTILYQSDPELEPEKLQEIFSSTFYNVHKPIRKNSWDPMIRFLLKYGFLKKSGGKIKITELGIKVNKSNINPMDAVTVLSMHANSSSDEILTVASTIDIVRNLNLSNNLDNARVLILKELMRGHNFDMIREKYGSFYDQELIDLASYTDLSLWKMHRLLSDKRIKGKITRIRKKLKEIL